MDIFILIAVKNNRNMLQECLESCIRQTLKPQIIVIDGASTDGTIEVIKEYSEHLYYWESGVDRNLFAALNKGLRHVPDDRHVLVLGSDDCLYDNHVIEAASGKIQSAPGHSVYYGRVAMREQDGSVDAKRYRGLPWADVKDKFLKGHASGIPHQATFQLAKSLKQFNGFDENYYINGDYDALYRVLKNEEPIFFESFFVAYMRRGGVSTCSGANIKIAKERLYFCCKHHLWISWLRYLKNILSYYVSRR